MTIHQKIKNALASTGIPVKEDFYGGGLNEYITWTLVRDHAAVIADNKPTNEVAELQIHWFLPRSKSYSTTRKIIRHLLCDSEFTWPVVTTIEEPDGKTRHIVFECQVENDDETEENKED